MGCGASSPTTEDPYRIEIQANDSQFGVFPGPQVLPGERRYVPSQVRQNFTLPEWLDITAQIERTFFSSSGPCQGPDPLTGPAQVLAASLNAAFAATRGVSFSYSSAAWHPDRARHQYNRTFVIDAAGECCIRTQETTLEVKVPEGVKPGQTFSASALDGQLIPVRCPKESGPGSMLPLTLRSPALAEQALSLTVPEGAAGGETIHVAVPGGGTMGVRLPTTRPRASGCRSRSARCSSGPCGSRR